MNHPKETISHLNNTFDESLFKFSQVNVHSLPDPSENFNTKATPFVKWVGGKRSIMAELTARLPEQFDNYFEPFVGGGALFFEIAPNLKNATLCDINMDLLLTYQSIKKSPHELIQLLKKHAKNHSKEYYYEVRAQHELENPIEIAARFLYLNKTCFNGLWRVNKKGEFNVPMGKYKNPNIVQEENIWACNKALQGTDIQYREFDTIEPKKGDFVYFDPPYHPTDNNSFTTYTKLDFSEKDQIRLKEFCDTLDKKGVKFMLSNSDTLFINDLYKNYNVQLVSAPRFVNCKPTKRNSVKEVLVTNY